MEGLVEPPEALPVSPPCPSSQSHLQVHCGAGGLLDVEGDDVEAPVSPAEAEGLPTVDSLSQFWLSRAAEVFVEVVFLFFFIAPALFVVCVLRDSVRLQKSRAPP